MSLAVPNAFSGLCFFVLALRFFLSDLATLFFADVLHGPDVDVSVELG